MQVPKTHRQALAVGLALQVQAGIACGTGRKLLAGKPGGILRDLSAPGIVLPNIGLLINDIRAEIQHQEALPRLIFIPPAQRHTAAPAQNLCLFAERHRISRCAKKANVVAGGEPLFRR